MVKRFKLKAPEENATIEEYLRNAIFYNADYKNNLLINIAQNPSKALAMENKELYRKIERNPSKYFNFGIKLPDFSLMIFKHIVMRLEREMLKGRVVYKHKKYRTG